VPDNSSLDIVFAGAGALADLANSFDGAGSARLADKSLAKLEVFGGLSRLLGKANLNFGAYRLERATSTFTLKNGALSLPDLRVTGDSCEITARGTYTLNGGKLRFRALLTPRSGETIPVLNAVTSITNKWAHLFPVEISGTLQKPVWSVDPTVFGDPMKRGK